MSSPYLALQREYITWPDGRPIESAEEVFRDTPTRSTTVTLTKKNADGSATTVEHHEGIEVPEHWTDLQAQILATKYCRGRNSALSKRQESSYKDVFGRIVRVIQAEGLKHGYFASKKEASAFCGRLAYAMTQGWCMFNSPVLFNIGAKEFGQMSNPSACFLIDVEDSMDSILDTYRVEGKIFKSGSGVGLNLSTLRAKNESLTGGGRSSGPISFMRGLDASAGSIKSGGTVRRAAVMRTMDDWHLDVEEFIGCKVVGEKVAGALAAGGFSVQWNDEGGAYDYAPFQNSNNSVRLSDAFMRAALDDKEWTLHGVVETTKTKTIKARTLLRQMAEACWASGDPGVQFSGHMDRMHTCPNSGRLMTTNPCSEYVFLPWTSCNLSSVTLTKMLTRSGAFNRERFRSVVSMLARSMDILIEQGEFPDPRIDKGTRDTRPLGIGFSDLGALLMGAGLGYASRQGLGAAADITSLMTAVGYEESAYMAGELGPFALYADNREPMLRVMGEHATSAAGIGYKYASPEDGPRTALWQSVGTTHGDWERTVRVMTEHGARNAQMTVLAPCGTISFLMNNSTTGVEPVGGVVQYKNLAGGGTLRLTVDCVEKGLQALGYPEAEVRRLLLHADEVGTLTDAESGLKPEHCETFLTAFQGAPGDRTLAPMDHLKMLEAVAPFLSGSASKTANLPNEATVEDIEELYVAAWKMGIKAVAVYRNESKGSQVISSQKKVEHDIEEKLATQELRPVRKRLPAERSAITRKFQVGAVEGYISVSLYPDSGLPGEVFVNISKEGSTLSGLLDAFATSVSLNLQYGVPLEAMIDKFAMTRFEPAGFTGDPDLPVATSIIDFLFRWMGLRFLPRTEESEGARPPQVHAESRPDAVGVCTKCGVQALIPNGKCRVCSACGQADGGCGA